MKYILKLTAFALLGLLLVSCSKSSSNSKHNTSIKLQGVLEKGKATDGLCKIATLDGKAYSESNHIKNGSYVASVPAGAFDVTCTISKYIDDTTGKPVTPAKPIVLEAISFAKAGKNKTVNVNVLTDLVAKELMHSKNKITSESSFNTVREDAERVALREIKAEVKQDIGDIDTLHLDNTADNPLTKVSLAIQEQIDKPNSKITTVSGALQAAKDAHSIATQDVSKLSPKAIATPPNNIQPPKPTGQTQKITLTGATIGGKVVTTNPTSIDKSKAIAFSLPANDLVDVANLDSVYITSDKAGQTKPIKLEGGKNIPYIANDVKDLFKTNEVTTFTICVVPTITTLDLTANRQCQSADRKVSFTATATSSTGGTGTVTTITLTGATIGGKAVSPSPTDIDKSKAIAFSLPANDLVDVADSDSVYITSDKSGQTKLIKLEGGKNAPYTANDVKDLFKTNEVTTFTICVVPTITTLDSTANGQCLSAKIKKTFTATAIISGIVDLKPPIEVRVAGVNVLGDTNEIDGRGIVSFSLPKTVVTKLPTESVYITNSKSTEILVLNAMNYKDKYIREDISSLLLPVGQTTTLYICILPTEDTPDSELCRNSPTQQNLPVMVVDTKSEFETLTSDVMIGKTQLNTQGPTPIENTSTVAFSMPETLVTKLSTEAVYITSTYAFVKAIKLNLVGDKYETANIKSLFPSAGTISLILCIYPEDITPTFETCYFKGTKQGNKPPSVELKKPNT